MILATDPLAGAPELLAALRFSSSCVQWQFHRTPYPGSPSKFQLLTTNS